MCNAQTTLLCFCCTKEALAAPVLLHCTSTQKTLQITMFLFFGDVSVDPFADSGLALAVLCKGRDCERCHTIAFAEGTFQN